MVFSFGQKTSLVPSRTANVGEPWPRGFHPADGQRGVSRPSGVAFGGRG